MILTFFLALNTLIWYVLQRIKTLISPQRRENSYLHSLEEGREVRIF